MKKAFVLIELLISIFLGSLLMLLLTEFVVNSYYSAAKFEVKSNDLNEVITLSEEGKYDSVVTQNNGMVLKEVKRGKYSIQYLE